MGPDLEFYRGKRVFVTGHTGFKGAWLCRILANAGAQVTGFALEPDTCPNLSALANQRDYVTDIRGDVRSLDALREAMDAAQPELVFHLAAQPLVRVGYERPVHTYETNVMGTVNLLECVRHTPSVRSVLNVTTDKVYQNNEWVWGYRENEPLDGFDPYSNSKSCSELVTHCYQKSYFSDGPVAVSTARAGNVIGGGDFARDRIIPDCIRAALKGEEIVVRSPYSVRPYQHVLEPLSAYLLIAEKQYQDRRYADSYNVGPDDRDCFQTGVLVDMFAACWGGGVQWVSRPDGGPHEAHFLKLDCSKIKSVFGWSPRWDLRRAVAKTVEWTKCWQSGGDVRACMDQQISEFLSGGTADGGLEE